MEQEANSSTDSSPMGLIIPQLRSDPLYCEFLDDDFDAKTVAAKAVENLAITDNLAKISAGTVSKSCVNINFECETDRNVSLPLFSNCLEP